MQEQPFWKTKKMNEMSREEWESLCDGCAQCCLHKLEDEDTGEILYTNVVCKLLDTQACACGDYPNRHARNPECLELTPRLVRRLHWMPDTCAYRLVARGEDLPEWHYLVCGDREEVHRRGISVRGKVISEADIDLDRLEDYVVGQEGYDLP